MPCTNPMGFSRCSPLYCQRRLVGKSTERISRRRSPTKRIPYIVTGTCSCSQLNNFWCWLLKIIFSFLIQVLMMLKVPVPANIWKIIFYWTGRYGQFSNQYIIWGEKLQMCIYHLRWKIANVYLICKQLKKTMFFVIKCDNHGFLISMRVFQWFCTCYFTHIKPSKYDSTSQLIASM